MGDLFHSEGCGVVWRGGDLGWFSIVGERPWVGRVMRLHGYGVFDFWRMVSM